MRIVVGRDAASGNQQLLDAERHQAAIRNFIGLHAAEVDVAALGVVYVERRCIRRDAVLETRAFKRILAGQRIIFVYTRPLSA